MRVVLCWGAVSGYMVACWRELASRPGIDLLIVTHSNQANSAFDASLTSGLNHRALAMDSPDATQTLKRIVRDHQAQAISVPGWLFQSFHDLASDAELRDVKMIMCMDTPMRRSWRQLLGRWRLRGFLSRMDRVMVPGERAFQLARYLDVPERKIRRGLYGVDYAGLSPLYAQRLRDHSLWPKRFLFTGRYVTQKGVDVLLDAYQRYRSVVLNPWPLTCCGMGPMQSQVASAAGVEDLGFQQPGELPRVLASSGAFVLASRFDPWPLVVVEACAAGLPVICTEACGSAVELVRAFYSGVTVATDDAESLAQGLRWAHEKHSQLPEMGERAQHFAAAYSAQAWAHRWQRMLEELPAAKVVSKPPRALRSAD